MVSETEQNLWKTFLRRTGRTHDDRGLSDVLHILSGPECLPHLLDYLMELQLDPHSDARTIPLIEAMKEAKESM